MPKTIYLIRHAKSNWKDESLSDAERPLNKRGKHDAPLMGKVLKQRGEKPQLIISSPAKRAYSTAKLIAEELNCPKSKIQTDPRLYMAGVSEFMSVIENIDDKTESVMIFSHNPGITYFVNFISGSDIENIPTAGAARIDFGISGWKGITNTRGELKFFLFPKMFTEEKL